jgi:hypothetical protein
MPPMQTAVKAPLTLVAVCVVAAHSNLVQPFGSNEAGSAEGDTHVVANAAARDEGDAGAGALGVELGAVRPVLSV